MQGLVCWHEERELELERNVSRILCTWYVNLKNESWSGDLIMRARGAGMEREVNTLRAGALAWMRVHLGSSLENESWTGSGGKYFSCP